MRFLLWFLGAVLLITELARAWHDPGAVFWFLLVSLGVWGLAGLALTASGLLRLTGRSLVTRGPAMPRQRAPGAPTATPKEE